MSSIGTAPSNYIIAQDDGANIAFSIFKSNADWANVWASRAIAIGGDYILVRSGLKLELDADCFGNAKEQRPGVGHRIDLDWLQIGTLWIFETDFGVGGSQYLREDVAYSKLTPTLASIFSTLS